MKQIHILNGKIINEPNNYEQLEIELNYDRDGNTQAVSVNDWEYGVEDASNPNDAVIMIKKHLAQGLRGGVGVTEGMAHEIQLSDEMGKVHTLFSGYADLWSARYANGKVTATSTELGNIDWMEQNAYFTFEYLYENLREFDSSKFIAIPYCIEKKQNAIEIVTIFLSIFVISIQLQKALNDYLESSARVSTDPLMWGEIAAMVARIAYITILIVSILGLVVNLINLIVQPVKYHYGMYVKDLVEIGCKHLGLGFSSSILQREPFSKLVLIPEKYNVRENTGLFAGVAGWFNGNNESTGYYKGTFGQLMVDLKAMFHARIVIDNNVLYFEPDNFRLRGNGITLPNIYDSEQEFELNYQDFKSTILLSFSTDINDRHTIQEYRGTAYQITQTQRIVNNRQMVLARNLEQISIPYALAKKKTSLSVVENLLQGFLASISAFANVFVATVNGIIALINGIIAVINKILRVLRKLKIYKGKSIQSIPYLQYFNFGQTIENRIGMMKMETDYINVPKLVLLDVSGNSRNTKIAGNNESDLTAKYLWENFHYLKAFASVNGHQPNQYLIRKIDEFPFSFADFERTKNNAYIRDYNGNDAELLSLKFNPIKETASCTYRVKRQYTNNIELKYAEPSGQ